VGVEREDEGEEERETAGAKGEHGDDVLGALVADDHSKRRQEPDEGRVPRGVEVDVLVAVGVLFI
jgi:hypothetical protein